MPKFNIFWILRPQCPEDVGVTFTLYTKQIPNGEEIQVINTNFFTFNYRVDRNHKILIHGFNGNARDEWLREAKDAFLKNMDVNVITVDWQKGASVPYFAAAPNTMIVGQETALLIQTILAKKWSSPDKFHIIGHSLGAHAAGFAGERVPGLGRISGLDPASPLFTPLSPDVSGPDYGRLDCTDAQFVDVIHSETKFLGIKRAIGHLDFYPNGRFHQPGCEPVEFGQWDACSHLRSGAFFIESINPSPFCKFTSAQCKPFDGVFKEVVWEISSTPRLMLSWEWTPINTQET